MRTLGGTNFGLVELPIFYFVKMKTFILVLCAVALSCFAGTLVDSRDGRTYRTVKIDNQEWMAENLSFKSDSSWCYNDDSGYCLKYGRLYSWHDAMRVCPSGWHLPSRAEFETLRSSAGNLMGGCVLRSKDLWEKGRSCSDVLGFGALPAGIRLSNGEFEGEGWMTKFWSTEEYKDDRHGRPHHTGLPKYTYFWSYTERSRFATYLDLLDFVMEASLEYYYDKNGGFSLRCIKNPN